MSELQSAPGLGALDARYETVGELRETPGVRRYIARRRSDRADVLITVVRPEGGGENNALAHFASDAQILARIDHHSVPRVIEGRWAGSDRFAVVSERVYGATLHEMLSAGERLPNPRIATVLHEVHEVLGWARANGVIHRGVTIDSLYFEKETHEPRMGLMLTPIPIEGLPDARSDAQTIGRLAWAMFGGHEFSDAAPESLSDLRPDLAQRVVDETTAMVIGRTAGDDRDVERFLSVIAMGDVLRQGELEVAQLQAEMIEERRVERIRLEAEARASADRAAAIEARLKKERSEFAKQIATEEKRIASDAQQVAVERAQLEQERLDFSKRVAALSEQTGTRTSTPAPAIPVISYVEDEFLKGERRRFAWMIPVATISVLLLLIIAGASIARRGVAPRTITIGRSTIVPTLPESAAGTLPRGGFLNQGAAGARKRAVIRPDTVAKHDSILPIDTIAKEPPDTLFLQR